MVYSSLIGFILFVTLFLGIAFSLSYFWWADRHKTPEVIAAEVMQFSEQITNFLSILAVGAIAFITTIIIIIKTAV
ncbi:hypothetical protein H6F44_09325 [Pseudanabaena sp. FACHB-1277]|jgi:hypothetical protein|uniref:Uncharacterized protein n=1 Tax=Pseudanabaena cinerea FACHB-1277 TaxID=2949581 RepID=A0A926USK3_9CYAN|nr:hypothetical protein [Pseudanabaena cinerea]MBD2150317.1 hypothetical protein [Pseudanabaena cinerea FACHB-1277]